MNLEFYFDRLERIDENIRRKSTGNASEFSEKLNITERHLYRYLKFMREYLGLDIEYSKYRKTYYYLDDKGFDIKKLKHKSNSNLN